MLLCGSAIADTASSAILLAVEQQRIGSITPSVPAAGLDPAYVPGLTPPRSDADGTADAVPEQAEAPEEPKAELKAEPTAEPEVEPEADAEVEAEDDAEAEDTEAAEKDEDAGDGDDDGPVFDVSDRRGAIVADRVGVRFRLDEEEAEFTWDEIAAVEIDTPRFGRRFSVTVYTPERRWYDAQVEATSRGLLKEWTSRLDTVLDTYFEAEEEPEEAEETAPEPAEDADTEATSTDEDAAKDEAEPDTSEDETSDKAEPAQKS